MDSATDRLEDASSAEIIKRILDDNWSIIYGVINDVNNKDLKNGELLYVSRKSGEVECLAEVFPPQHFQELKHAMTMAHKALRFTVLRTKVELQIINHLSPKEFVVFAYLRATIGMYNIIPDLRVREIAKKTGSSSSTVVSAIRTLREANVIYKRTDLHGGIVNVLHPGAGWRGPLNHNIKSPGLKWVEELK